MTGLVVIYSQVKQEPVEYEESSALAPGDEVMLDQSESSLQGPPYKCSVCGLTFPYPSRLLRHLATHNSMETTLATSVTTTNGATTGDNADNEEVDDDDDDDDDDDVKEFGCELCEKSFDTLSELTSHQVYHATSGMYEEAGITQPVEGNVFKPFKCKCSVIKWKNKTKAPRFFLHESNEHGYNGIISLFQHEDVINYWSVKFTS